MIKAVLFDIDGTLIDSKKANNKFYSDILVSAGYKRPTTDALARIFNLTAMETIAYLTGEKNKATILSVWEKMNRFPYPNNLTTIPSLAKHMVVQLKKQGFYLGLVTGRVRRGIKDFFQVFGERKYFNTVVAFEDYAHAKPNPESLLLASSRLNVQPRDSVYIGDALTDKQAATYADMFFIGCNNKNLSEGTYMNNFSELPDILKQLPDLKKD